MSDKMNKFFGLDTPTGLVALAKEREALAKEVAIILAAVAAHTEKEPTDG